MRKKEGIETSEFNYMRVCVCVFLIHEIILFVQLKKIMRKTNQMYSAAFQNKVFFDLAFHSDYFSCLFQNNFAQAVIFGRDYLIFLLREVRASVHSLIFLF